MKHSIKLGSRRIFYTLKHSARTRRTKLAVHPGGEVVITTPRVVSMDWLETIIRQKAAWIVKSIQRLRHIQPLTFSHLDYQRYKGHAYQLAWTRISELSTLYNVKVERVSIRNQKTRWGSCSRKGRLSFNYRIVFLSPEQCDYVIAHELAHMIEFNHSPQFWTLVASASPHYKRIKHELKHYSLR